MLNSRGTACQRFPPIYISTFETDVVKCWNFTSDRERERERESPFECYNPIGGQHLLALMRLVSKKKRGEEDALENARLWTFALINEPIKTSTVCCFSCWIVGCLNACDLAGVHLFWRPGAYNDDNGPVIIDRAPTETARLCSAVLSCLLSHDVRVNIDWPSPFLFIHLFYLFIFAAAYLLLYRLASFSVLRRTCWRLRPALSSLKYQIPRRTAFFNEIFWNICFLYILTIF